VALRFKQVQWCVALGVAALLMQGAPGNCAPAAGKIVVGIRLQCDAHLTLDEFSGKVTQAAGEPLDPAKVDQSLKNLYATGRFQDLRADAQPAPGGVDLIFVARAQYFIGLLRVEGTPDGLEAQGLATASHLRLGQPLLARDLKSAVQRLQEVLKGNGYYQAQIRTRSRNNPNTLEANVFFTISAGPPARLSGVEFQGHPGVPARQLASRAGWKRGKQLTSAKLEKGLNKIHQYYVKHHHLEATLAVVGRSYDPAQHTEMLAVRVEAGPEVRVRQRGASVGSSKEKELLPMYSEGVSDPFAVEQGRKNLEDYFQQRGYFSASVQAQREVRSGGQEVDVTYRVNLGPAGEFDGYSFEGNRAFTHEQLEPLVSIQAAGFFHDRGVFSQRLLDRDVKNLRDLYHAQGFPDARIIPHVDRQYDNLPHHLFVTFGIEEGPRELVANLGFQGVDDSAKKGLWPYLLNKPGEPYSRQRVERDREAIRTYYADHGYLQARVDYKATPAGEHRMEVEYQVAPGEQDTIRDVVLLGNRHTRPGIMRRELTFQPDQPLSQSALLESQRKLYDLGVFNEVEIAPQDPQGPPGSKNVLVSVEETRRWTLGYGFGVDVQRLGSNQPQGTFKASPRLSLGLTRLNVGGRGQTFTLRGRLSTLDTGASLSYLIPHLPTRHDLSLRFNALDDRSQEVSTFTSKRQEAAVNFEKRWSPNTLFVARYSYRKVRALDLSGRISPEQIPILSRTATVGMIDLSYVNDHRNNPADATAGSYSVADAGISWSHLGSQANFLRFSGQNSTYYRLAKHLVFARNTRFAVESPYGPLLRQVVPTQNGGTQVVFTHDIPLPERFFMGGSESHRGFSINQAGPRDPQTGFPIGGNALFFNSLELRMPFANNKFGFVLFHDAGNVYSSIRLMRLLKVTQNSPTDLDYTVHAVGAGIRYRTPVGPLRFDVGYNLNPPQYQFINNNVLEVKQLPRFNFFLSIGQSF
jgi:outer membrane protein insertion porin family